jgi:hypothetical protein
VWLRHESTLDLGRRAALSPLAASCVIAASGAAGRAGLRNGLVALRDISEQMEDQA